MERRFAVACLGLLVLEGAALVAFGSREVRGDEGQYLAYARHLVDDGVFSRGDGPSLFRTPGYPAFLAALRLLSDSLVLVTVVQVALLGALAWLVYLTAMRVAGRTETRIATVACLVYLPFVWLTNMELTETLASVLVAAVVVLLVRARALWHYGLVGIFVGCAALVRPVFAAAPILIVAGMLIWPRRTRWAALLVPVCAALVLAPWVARNYNVTGQFTLSSGAGISLYASAMQYQHQLGYTFTQPELDKLYGAAKAATRRGLRDARSGDKNVPLSARRELAVEDAIRKEAIDRFRRLGLTDVLRELPQRVAYLWAVADYVQVPGFTFWHALADAQQLLLLGFALAGAWIALKDLRRFWPVLLFPAYLTLVHLVLHSESRYSIPARSSVIVLASVGFGQALAHKARVRLRGAT